MGRPLLIVLFLAGCPAGVNGPARPATTPLPHGAAGAGRLPEPRAAGPALEAALARLRTASDAEAPGAMLAVALSDDPAAVDHLLVALAGPHALEAASALGLMGGDAAAQALLVALQHSDPAVRLRAASGLRASRSPSTLAQILAVLTARRPVAREACRMLLVAAARAAGGDGAADVRAALTHLPASCDIGALERWGVEWRLGDAGALPSLLGAPAIGLEDPELVQAVDRASDPATLAAAREILQGARRSRAVATAALVLARAGDASARELVHDRLAHAAPAVCDTLGAGTAVDPRACGELRGLVVAAGLLSDPRDLPLLQRWSHPPASPARSLLFYEALYARAIHAGSAADPEIPRLLAEAGTAARALSRSWPRVSTPVALDVLAQAPDGVPTDLEACSLLLAWEDPRRLVVARALLVRDEAAARCRPLAGEVLAREGTDDDRRLVAEAAARLAGREGSGPTTAEPGTTAVAWARTAAKLPAGARPPWPVLRTALARAAFLIPRGGPDPAFLRGAADLGTLDSIVALRPASTATRSAELLLQLVRARTAEPRVAGRALARLVRGATDADVEATLAALLPDATIEERDERSRAEVELGRFLAAALAAPEARVRAFAARRLTPGPLAARAEVARLALADDAIPAAELVPLLDDPAPGSVAAVALRCGRTCVSEVAERLGSDREDVRAAAAVVAAAMREPALARALEEAVHGDGDAATEAAVALALMDRADDDVRRRLEQADARLGMGEGLPVRIALARTLAGIAPAWGGFRGAGLSSCRWARFELRPTEDARDDALAALASAAIAVRAIPEALPSMSPERQAVAADDLQEALSCFAGGLDLEGPFGALVSSTSVATRAAIAPAVVQGALLDPGSALLERLAADPDATVREHVLGAFRSVAPGIVRPFGPLLRRLAEDPSATVRQGAVRLLPVSDVDATPLLQRALEDSAPEVRSALLENPELGESAVADRVASLADDPDASVRVAAAMALGATAFPGGLPALRRLVAADETRAAALRSLCRRGGPDDLALALDAFRRLPPAERRTARASFVAARALLGVDPAPALRRILGDRDPETARLAVLMVSMAPLPESIAALEAAQRSRFPAVRRELAGVLARLRVPDPSPDAAATARLQALAARLLQDADSSVKCRALIAMAPGGMSQDDLDRLTGETGVTAAALRDRWSCASVPLFD